MKKDSGGKKPAVKSADIVMILLLFLAVFIFVFYRAKTASLEEELENSRISAEFRSKQINELNDEIKRNKFYADILFSYEDIENKLRLRTENIYPRVIPEFVPAERTEGFSSEYEEEIYSRNVRRMEKIVDYGAFAAEYISADKDREKRFAVMYGIKMLSDEICRDKKSETEKADAISRWIAENICYDDDAANSGVNESVISLENTLALQRSTCAGYSNLFAALCQSQGLCCLSIRGGTIISYNSDDITLENVPENHEWNAVFCGGEWLFYDLTWASHGRYRAGEYIFSSDISEKNLKMSFEKMTEDRRIDYAEYRNFYSALFESK